MSVGGRERASGSVSRVTRVADEEEDTSPPLPTREVNQPAPAITASPSAHVRSASASPSICSGDRMSRMAYLASGQGGDGNVAVSVDQSAPVHLGLTRSPIAKRSKPPLAQRVLQQQAVAAALVILQTNETGDVAPAPVLSRSNSLRRPGSTHPSPQLHVRSHSLSLDPSVVNQPNNPITAHNVQNLFERVNTPPSVGRTLSIGGGSGGASPRASPRPDLLRPASALRDKWAARTEELWCYYAGRGATHMPKKSLMQLSEDLFAEFIAKYKLKLRNDFIARHPNKEYSDAQCDKDLRTDLPFLLPAKPSSSDKPEADDYVHYIYRFTTREMRRVAAAAPGGTVSAAENGVGSIKASGGGGMGSIKSAHARSKSNLFNLDAPIGPAHSTSGGGLSSERPATQKLTKAEFTLGWGHCHDALFKCMEPERERPGTPCKLM